MKNNKAFDSGCDLWVLINNPESHWWKELNFRSAFLLSSLNKHNETEFTRSVSNETEALIKETEFPKSNFKSNSKFIFIGTENHFLNRWICLVKNASDIESDEFLKNTMNLKCNNIRFFFHAKLSPSFKASFPNAELISDSQ